VPNEYLIRFPHAAICQLKLFNSAGSEAFGTGFYIGNETLLTCGHNFWLPSQTWETVRLEVQPAYSPNMSIYPSKFYNVNKADVVHPLWLSGTDPSHDLAVLRVPGLPVLGGGSNGRQPGQFFRLANQSLSARAGIVVCGYGKVDGQDFGAQGQRMDGAHIAEATTDMVYYPIQTVGGHSGSPVFHGGMVIGVHTGGQDAHRNRAVLLNPTKIDWINTKA
jgi:V8-like Glu-specific endopeptidase